MPRLVFESEEDRWDFDFRLAMGLMTNYGEVDKTFALGRAQQIREFFISGEAGDGGEVRYKERLIEAIQQKYPDWLWDNRHKLFILPENLNNEQAIFYQPHLKCVEES